MIFFRICSAGILAVFLLFSTPALAHEVHGATLQMQAWYSEVEIMPEARKRLPWTKCCNKAEIVKAQFRVEKTTNGDEWYYWTNGSFKRIPPDIIHWGEVAPDKEATLFVYNGHETCFFPPEGGL
jgi:hypothetical protein